MIRLTRLNGSEMHLNVDLIATVESFHDTVVTLVDGRCYVVAEPAEHVVAAITRYRAELMAMAERLAAQPALQPVSIPASDRPGAESGAGPKLDPDNAAQPSQTGRVLMLRPRPNAAE